TTIAAPAGPYDSPVEDHEQQNLEKRALIGGTSGTTLLGVLGVGIAQSSALLSIGLGGSGGSSTSASTSRASSVAATSASSASSVATSASIASSAATSASTSRSTSTTQPLASASVSAGLSVSIAPIGLSSVASVNTIPTSLSSVASVSTAPTGLSSVVSVVSARTSSAVSLVSSILANPVATSDTVAVSSLNSVLSEATALPTSLGAQLSVALNGVTGPSSNIAAIQTLLTASSLRTDTTAVASLASHVSVIAADPSQTAQSSLSSLASVLSEAAVIPGNVASIVSSMASSMTSGTSSISGHANSIVSSFAAAASTTSTPVASSTATCSDLLCLSAQVGGLGLGVGALPSSSGGLVSLSLGLGGSQTSSTLSAPIVISTGGAKTTCTDLACVNVAATGLLSASLGVIPTASVTPVATTLATPVTISASNGGPTSTCTDVVCLSVAASNLLSVSVGLIPTSVLGGNVLSTLSLGVTATPTVYSLSLGGVTSAPTATSLSEAVTVIATDGATTTVCTDVMCVHDAASSLLGINAGLIPSSVLGNDLSTLMVPSQTGLAQPVTITATDGSATTTCSDVFCLHTAATSYLGLSSAGALPTSLLGSNNIGSLALGASLAGSPTATSLAQPVTITATDGGATTTCSDVLCLNVAATSLLGVNVGLLPSSVIGSNDIATLSLAHGATATPGETTLAAPVIVTGGNGAQTTCTDVLCLGIAATGLLSADV
ncbi:hypothetical protein KCU63_g17774, partial [Aureobasidium melanogenum]